MVDVEVEVEHVIVMVVGMMEQVVTKEVLVDGQLTDTVVETLNKVITLVVEEVELVDLVVTTVEVLIHQAQLVVLVVQEEIFHHTLELV